MQCTVCLGTRFEEVFRHDKLKVFSALRDAPYREKFRFDAVLMRCTRCGFVGQNPSKKLQDFLTNFYTHESSFLTAPPAAGMMNNKSAFNIEFMRTHVKAPVRRVLEIGSYDGYFLDSVREAIGAREAVGVEILKMKNRYLKVRVVNDYYPTKKLAGEKFDLIIMMSVLEHIFTPRDFMREIDANLSEKGSVVISIPNEGLAFKYGMPSYQHQHISYFTPATIRRFLASTGFRTDAIYTKDLDRILVVASRAKGKPHAIVTKDDSSTGLKKRYAQTLARFKRITKDPRVALYGACNAAHNLIQMAATNPATLLFDGDPRKAGKYFCDMKKPIHSWEKIDAFGVSDVLIIPLAFTPAIYGFLKKQPLDASVKKLFDI